MSLQSTRDLEIRHGQRFKRIFGRTIHAFMDWQTGTGFDPLAFEEAFFPECAEADNKSLSDFVQERFGDDAVALIKSLLAIPSEEAA